jgi:hypothetical protein
MGEGRRVVPGLIPGALALGALVLVATGGGPAGAAPAVRPTVVRPTVVAHTYGAFTDPRPVPIEGYSGSAMEPFMAPDGRTLFFNTPNVAPGIPTLQYASRAGPDAFDYRGPVRGANVAGFLSGTPALDRSSELYFVSTRSYVSTGSTVYSGRFGAGRLRRLHLVPGVTAGSGLVDFDVDVSPDGSRLYVSVGRFVDGSAPTSAELVVYDRVGTGFVPDPRSTRLLAEVNRAGSLTYAAAVSADGRELFFTQADPVGSVPEIEEAVRSGPGQPFGPGTPIGAITGFAEAPSISADGTTLYFHRLVGTTYEIERVTRRVVASARAGPGSVTGRADRPRRPGGGARSGPSRPAGSGGRSAG